MKKIKKALAILLVMIVSFSVVSVGASGMSAYHGKESFKVFSHHRAVVTTTTLLDLPFRYMPYTFFKWIKGVL